MRGMGLRDDRGPQLWWAPAPGDGDVDVRPAACGPVLIRSIADSSAYSGKPRCELRHFRSQSVEGAQVDSVLSADPGAILRESRRGGSDLNVAVTRATQRLGVITDDSLPNVLHRHPRSMEGPGTPMMIDSTGR